MTTAAGGLTPNPWPQTGSFDTSQYTNDYNPLVKYPSSMQLPDTAAALTEFVANLYEELGQQTVAEIEADLTSFFQNIVTYWDDLETELTDAVEALFTGNWDAFWTDVLEALGFSESDTASFITYLNNAGAAWDNWVTALDNTANATITDLTTWWNGFDANITSLISSLFGGTEVSNITVIEQDIINFVTNAISGGSAPTSSNSPAASILDALLGIPHTNVIIPPSPGSGTITHDNNTNGTPYTGPVTGLETLTPWYHTCGVDADYLTARISYYTTSSTVIALSYGGVSLQLLESKTAADGATTTQIYGMPNPQTVTSLAFSLTVWTPLGSYINIIAAEADSYIGVGSVGSTQTASGANSDPALTIASATNDYILNSIALSSTVGGETLTGYSQTSQYNSGDLAGPSSAMVLLAGDAAGASSVNFAATALSTTQNYWAAAAVNLIPLAAGTLGSGFRVANTLTTNVSATSGNNLFPDDFFNGIPTITADGTFSTTGNTYTVEHAGWYQVTIAVLLYSLLTGQFIGVNLVQTPTGGSPSTKRGHTSYIAAAGSDTVCAFTFQVYCNAGDTLQPGYYSSFTGTAFAGTTDGYSTYFEVSLNNRSLF